LQEERGRWLNKAAVAKKKKKKETIVRATLVVFYPRGAQT
jgi:hypothetical protein